MAVVKEQERPDWFLVSGARALRGASSVSYRDYVRRSANFSTPAFEDDKRQIDLDLPRTGASICDDSTRTSLRKDAHTISTSAADTSSDLDDAIAFGPSHQLHHQKHRKRQYCFLPATDELLLRETLAHNPFVADFGAVRAMWKKVANVLSVGIDSRRCRERVAILLKKHKMSEQVYGGGATEEGIPSNLFSHNAAETDRMLREVSLLADALPANKKQENNASAVAVPSVTEGTEQFQLHQQLHEEQQTREAPVLEDSGSNTERKRPREEVSHHVDLLSFLLAHEASEHRAKLKMLELEEKKLALEERRLKLKEEKA